MKTLNAETVWHMPSDELVLLIENRAFSNRTGKIRFYAPSFVHYKNKYFRTSHDAFPSISITGSSCALKCEHCNGKVLDTMVPAMSQKELFNLCARLEKSGAEGCLISGGCLPDGSVPLGKFIDTIAKIKKELKLTVFVHTGIIDFSTAKQLKDAGVDAALIDVIGSDETIKKTCNLNVTVEDYVNSLNAMQQADLTLVPHVIVGLHDGELKGELYALKMIAAVKPSAVVVIAFMPIHGTAMAKVKPPHPADIAKVTAVARLTFPKIPIALGCVRPKGKHRAETDILALKAGVNAIAFPSEEVVKFAEEQGYTFSFSSYCCAQIYADTAF